MPKPTRKKTAPRAPVKGSRARTPRARVPGQAAEPRRVAVSAKDLRWTVDSKALGFATTAELPPLVGVHDQDRALEALHLGADLYAPGYNVYCLDLTGPDRLEIATAALLQAAPRYAPAADRCYVRNFRDAQAPRLVEIPRGTARRFKRDMDDLVEQLSKHLGLVFEEDRFASRVREITDAHQRKERELLGQVHDLASKGGFAVAQVDGEEGATLDLLYRVGGHQLSMPDLEAAVREAGGGSVPTLAENADEARALAKQLNGLDLGRIRKAHEEMREILRRTLVDARKLARSLQRQVTALEREESLIVVEGVVSELASRYAKVPAIVAHLEELKVDVLDHLWLFKRMARPQAPSGDEASSWEEGDDDVTQRQGVGDILARYRVNVLLDNTDRRECPVLVESNPTRRNLLGSIIRVMDAAGHPIVDHRSLRPGSLLAADGGYLVLDAADVAADPETWRALKRVLRGATLDMRDAVEERGNGPSSVLRPDPIRLTVKVVMVGDEATHDYLDELDADFKHVFRIRAEFDWLTDRSLESVRKLGSFVQGLVEREQLRPFTADGVAALAEHAARVAERGGKMLSRFDLLADVVRQAEFAAREAKTRTITGTHVRTALESAARRSSLSAEAIREAMRDGRILISTEGSKVAQVNGLAVRSTIEQAFGYPVRITAAIAPGTGGIVNIEREARLSGSIHDKATLIVQGYLSHQYGHHVPLAFNASVAFEQLYGGIEGDSASTAEIYALLSALSEVPVDQGLAVTGSVNQVGEIQPVGGVNEKVEGWFDACVACAGGLNGLTGRQGVLLPRSNVPDLMLRRDVVDAARAGRFHVYAISTVDEGIPLLTGRAAGVQGKGRPFPESSLHAATLARLVDLASRAPQAGDAWARPRTGQAMARVRRGSGPPRP